MSLGVLATKDCGLRSVEEIIHEVDMALYKAKADSRNCVRFARVCGDGGGCVADD